VAVALDSIADLVREHAAACPDSVAIEDGERRLTYAELEGAAAGIAAALRTAGLGDEEPVGVCLPRSWEAVASFLGVVRAGGAYVPISPTYPAERQRRMLELAGARFVLTTPEHSGALPAAVEQLDAGELASAEPGEATEAAPGGDRLAYVLFTSGSTGEPKGVEVTHRNLINLFHGGGEVVPRREDVVLQIVPLEFDVSGLEIWGALLNGARLVIAPRGRPDPRALGQLIAARGVTFLGISTGLLHELVAVALDDLAGVRVAVAAGDVLSPVAAAELCLTHRELRLFNGYGPTEATILASTYEYRPGDEDSVPIGKALPGYRLHVLDEDGEPVAPGNPGELWIGGEGVARGYRNDPERTAERFQADPFAGGRMYRSGDLVRAREDGELLFLGRTDDQVKISGQRVEPGEVERALFAHPEVREAAVIARAEVDGHKRLLGYVAPRGGAEPDPGELRAHLEERLPSFMVPSWIGVLEQLPVNERGKIDHDALPSPRRESGNGSAPKDPRVARIAALMAEVLTLEAVGADEDFFALGGSSLLAIRLVGMLRHRLDAAVDINAVFEAPTAALLAELVERAPATAALPPLRPGLRTAVAPLTAAQRRAWLFGRMHPESIAYQFAAIFRFEGQLNTSALEGALADLLARHEILRTGFETRDGEPVQVIHERCEAPLEKIDLRGESSLAWARLVRSRVRSQIDPEAAPLLRWTLARLGEEEWVLVHVEHHLIHDGWSFAVLAGELAHLYSARAEGREPSLPQPQVQFQDYARWERATNTSEEVFRQVGHWAGRLQADPPLLELPADRPRPARESFLGGSVRRRVDAELAGQLQELAQSAGGTLFMVALAAFLTQLQRYSSEDDLQIGSGLANRRDPLSEELIGMIVNTVPLRCDLSGDPTVHELLERVRASALESYGNADAPFDAIVETLRPTRDPRRSPLIQTLFSFHDAPRSEERWSGLRTKLVQAIPNGTAKADLNVIGINDGDGTLTFAWEHSDLFTDATADRLAGHHLQLLRQFAANPEARLSELSLLTPEEDRALTNSSQFDRTASVPELVERQARRAPEAVALVDQLEALSYQELTERARCVAGFLRSRGVEQGDCVAVLLPRSARSAVAYLGVLGAGAAYVPLDVAHPAARIARAVLDAGAKVAIVHPELVDRLPAGLDAVDLGEAEEGEPIEPLSGPEDLAYVMYTSGSTGRPKGVEVTHRNVARLVDDPDFAELGPGTTMLHAASPAFDATTLELWGPLANGGTVAVLAEQPSPDAVVEAVTLHGVTTMWLTAGLFHELVDRRPECFGWVRHVLAGGDVLSPSHVARALAALPPEGKLSNGYGPTETTTFALTHDLRPGDRVGATVPLGRPIQATVCEVVDAAGQPAPVGVPGELWIGGDGVSRGYRGDPELTAERFVADPRSGERRYRTGDRVRRRADGTIEFLGRLDRQLKVRGFRVEPAEIEAALREHPAVGDVAVAPYERAEGDKALAAYVVPADGTLDPAELRQHATSRLPAAMVPAAWIELESLPLNANGKVDRERLPAPSREHLARGEERDTAAASDTERQVIAAFERVLNVENVGVEEDFFALGGHSLLAVALFAQLEEASGKRLPLAVIFEASTPRALAALLSSGATPRRWSNMVPIKPAGTRPPLFALTAGDGNVVGFAPLARHISADQPLYALQPSGLDGQAAIDRGIAAMAASCIEELRTVQPHGPYLLAGRCNGATVAFEIAQQLRAAGEEVALLASLDSDPPNAGPLEIEPGVRTDPLMEAAWLRARNAGEEVPDRGGPDGVRAWADWLRGEVAPGISRYALEIWHWREDLQQRWPENAGFAGPVNTDAFRMWLWQSGVPEQKLEPRLLIPAPRGACYLPDGHRWDWALEWAWHDLDREPSDPLTPRGWKQLRGRLLEPLAEGRANRYLLGVASGRPDLAAAFPDPLGAGLEALRSWAWVEGIEQGLSPALLPPPPEPLPRRLRLALALRPARRLAERAAAEALGPEARKRLELHRDRLVATSERALGRRLPRARRRIEKLIEAAAREARDTYRADPWPGKVLLIISREYERKPAYIAWPERALGGIERQVLPLGHLEMLREPGAALLARCLDERITEALRS
jgi:amino acid adenylation domain-containing protein